MRRIIGMIAVAYAIAMIGTILTYNLFQGVDISRRGLLYAMIVIGVFIMYTFRQPPKKADDETNDTGNNKDE